MRTPEFVDDDGIGGWVRLDGESYIEVPGHESFSLPTSGAGLTVEAWMCLHRADFPGGYIHWFGKGERRKQEWGFRLYSSLDPGSPGRISAYAWNLLGGEGAGAHFLHSVPMGTWTHLVASYQPGDADAAGAGVVTYRNGDWQERPPDPTTLYDHPPRWRIFPEAGDAPLRFGTRSCDNSLVGGLAEVAVYPRVLEEDEIQQHFQAGIGVFV